MSFKFVQHCSDLLSCVLLKQSFFTKLTNTKDQARLIKAIESQLKWGSVSSWHNSMFTDLNKLILDQCGVDLSVTTLKRFFGTVKYDGSPSNTTLDTLSKFVGYDNWRSFKVVNGKGPYLKKFNLPAKGVYITIGFVTAFVIIAFFGTRRPIAPVDLESISFTSRPVTTGFPNSVVFDIELRGLSGEEMHIQQYWDPNRTITLEPGQQQATGIYYYPGFFRARLFVDGDTIRQHELFLKSEGWLGTVDYSPVPKYFQPVESSVSALNLPEEIKTEIEESAEPLTTSYHFVNELGAVDADNFKLETRLKVNYEDKWAVCKRAWVFVLASKSAIFIPLAIRGCSADNNVMLSDNYVDGAENDLSGFSVDLSNEATVSIESVDKMVSVSINGETAYQNSYTKPLGKVVGLRFEFLGHGEVSAFSLIDQNGNEVYF